MIIETLDSAKSRTLDHQTSVSDNMSILSHQRPLKISLISLHGLVRGVDAELGRDADTGGQVKYVVELARELSEHPNVGMVELLTRQIQDPKVSDDYAQVEESIAERAKIIRIPFGPKRYLRKEALWPYIEMFVDQTLQHYRRTGLPDIIHGHYADAGLAGAQLARLLHIPFVFTGHSLGRVKKQRLAAGEAAGRSAKTESDSLERKYRFVNRIEAEEVALETASMVVTSTNQEVRQQYELYDHYQPSRMEVIPPGVDLSQFSPPDDSWEPGELVGSLGRFLIDPNKPPILAMARPDERKNLERLVQTFGESEALQKHANLVLIMGTRDDLRELPKGQRTVLQNVLNLIDRHDLYGKVAYPKYHAPADVPDLYRWVASRKGVFVNPALTEPFGLTLLEAGACGVPIVATNDGGPTDIIGNCENGLLIDPLDQDATQKALLRVLTEKDQWQIWSDNGITGTRKHYLWKNHADRYLRDLDDILKESPRPALAAPRSERRLPEFDRLVITDLDNTLTGDPEGLSRLADILNEHANIGFGVSTGRHLDSAKKLLDELGLPQPDVLDTDAGTQLHYGPSLTPDHSWRKQIGYAWRPDEIRTTLDAIDGLYPQTRNHQSQFKLSYKYDSDVAPSMGALKKMLREAGLRAKLVLSLGMFLDIIPVRGGSDLTLRHLLWKWGFSPDNVLVAGDSGNDAGMLLGRTLGVVVGNYSPELERLRKRPRVYFAEACNAAGIIEGIEYYNFLDNIVIPNDRIESP